MRRSTGSNAAGAMTGLWVWKFQAERAFPPPSEPRRPLGTPRAAPVWRYRARQGRTAGPSFLTTDSGQRPDVARIKMLRIRMVTWFPRLAYWPLSSPWPETPGLRLKPCAAASTRDTGQIVRVRLSRRAEIGVALCQ